MKLKIDEKHHVSIPKVMVERNNLIDKVVKCKSLADYALKNKMDINILNAYIASERIVYDFEFWAASCVKVQDKQTKQMVPFVMRRPQLKLFKLLISELHSNLPIRVIL